MEGEGRCSSASPLRSACSAAGHRRCLTASSRHFCRCRLCDEIGQVGSDVTRRRRTMRNCRPLFARHLQTTRAQTQPSSCEYPLKAFAGVVILRSSMWSADPRCNRQKGGGTARASAVPGGRPDLEGLPDVAPRLCAVHWLWLTNVGGRRDLPLDSPYCGRPLRAGNCSLFRTPHAYLAIGRPLTLPGEQRGRCSDG